MKNKHILLVEDDPNLGDLLVDFLSMEGFEVTLARDGISGWETFQNGRYDLCLLDCMLPGKDGFSLASDIRKKDKWIPVIFLTAKSLKSDRLRGFDLGGDDYITKPFDEDELVRRINAILKRCEYGNNDNINVKYQLGEYSFDYSNLMLYRKGVATRMTQKEGDVLKILCERMNHVVRREDILVSIWGRDDYFHGRSLDVFISKIRKYLKEDTSVKIQNVHGVGFELMTKNDR